MQEETLGEKLSDAQSLVYTLADLQAEVDGETLIDTLSHARLLVDTLADFRKHWATRWHTRM